MNGYVTSHTIQALMLIKDLAIALALIWVIHRQNVNRRMIEKNKNRLNLDGDFPP